MVSASLIGTEGETSIELSQSDKGSTREGLTTLQTRVLLSAIVPGVGKVARGFPVRLPRFEAKDSIELSIAKALPLGLDEELDVETPSDIRMFFVGTSLRLIAPEFELFSSFGAQTPFTIKSLVDGKMFTRISFEIEDGSHPELRASVALTFALFVVH